MTDAESMKLALLLMLTRIEEMEDATDALSKARLHEVVTLYDRIRAFVDPDYAAELALDAQQ